MDQLQLKDKLSSIFATQKLAVLATDKDGQPYNCLVAIAGTPDLKHLMFSTLRSTRKYGELTNNPRVSILIDNRSNTESDFGNAVAVTATGTATEVQGVERDHVISIYLQKHPNLEDFVNSQDSALIRVDVTEYIISSFNNVWKLRP
jgi:nitroimidazol reductase NimA-like FMN-containing flavoprotein (pyridoxamine 5'-phosphate oxidase superfamily)